MPPLDMDSLAIEVRIHHPGREPETDIWDARILLWPLPLRMFGRRCFWCSTGLLEEGNYVTIAQAQTWLGLVN